MASASRRSFNESEPHPNTDPHGFVRRQFFVPVCDFGRADNIFYQSKASLAFPTPTAREILDKLIDATAFDGQDLTIPSHLFDRSDADEILTLIAANPQVRCRLLVAWGEELEVLRPRLMNLSSRQWQLDIIIDRDHQNLDLGELNQFSVRWLLVANRFFNLGESYIQLTQVISGTDLFVVFLEPLNTEQFLMGPDEVVLWRHWLSERVPQTSRIQYLSLVPLQQVEKADAFYVDLSTQVYRTQFASYGDLKALRRLLSFKLPNRASVVALINLIVFRLAIVFLQPKMVWNSAKTYVTVFFRWWLPGICRRLWTEVIVILVWRLPGNVKRVLTALKVLLCWQLPGLVKRILMAIYVLLRWQVPSLSRAIVHWAFASFFYLIIREWRAFLLGRAFTWLDYARIFVTDKVLPVILFPVFKIYWYLAYKFKKKLPSKYRTDNSS